MTKKHYEILAAALHYSRPLPTALNLVTLKEQWVVDVYSIADALERDNPKFDKNRFVAACVDGPKAPKAKSKNVKLS